MAKVIFTDKGKTYTGSIKSQDYGYLQVMVGDTEFIITEKQVVEVILEAEKEVSLAEIKQAFINWYNISPNLTPSKQTLAERLNCTVEDLQVALKKEGVVYDAIAKESRQSIVIPPSTDPKLSLTKIKKILQTMRDEDVKITEATTAVKLGVSESKLREFLKAEKIIFSNIEKKTKKTEKPIDLTALTEDQVVWRGKVITVSRHARQRFKERFGLETVENVLELVLDNVAEVKKDKTANKQSLRRHNGKAARYLVSYQHEMVMVFSKDLSTLMTVYSSQECLWLKNSVNIFVNIKFSQGWK